MQSMDGPSRARPRPATLGGIARRAHPIVPDSPSTPSDLSLSEGRLRSVYYPIAPRKVRHRASGAVLHRRLQLSQTVWIFRVVHLWQVVVLRVLKGYDATRTQRGDPPLYSLTPEQKLGVGPFAANYARRWPSRCLVYTMGEKWE